MKIDFSQRLKTLRGLQMYEKSLESMLVSRAVLEAPGREFATYEDIATVLDNAKVTLVDVVKGDGIPLCLKDVCVEALMLRGVHFSEALPGREDVIRYKLAVAIMESKEPLSVKPSEVRMIQELTTQLPASWGPAVTGQVALLLEQGTPEEGDVNDSTPQPKEERKTPKNRIPSGRN